jgi:hypothetical protein
MKFRWTMAVTPLALVAAVGAAQAATAKDPDGTAKKLAQGEIVTGKASASGEVTTITSDDGLDTIRLRKGAKVQYDGTEADAKGVKSESFRLLEGGVEANVGFNTRLGTRSFWAFPEKNGARAAFYAESFGPGTAYARNSKGSGLLRLLVTGNEGSAAGNTEVHLRADQGVTLERGGKGEFGYTTDANNEWVNGVVRVVYPLNTGLLVDIYVPKATSGFVRPKVGAAGKTEVGNRVSSWKSGKIRVVTLLGDNQTGDGSLAPGVTATIDNASGKIEIGFTEPEFTTLAAAVSLTSEFESLATSPISKPKKSGGP